MPNALLQSIRRLFAGKSMACHCGGRIRQHLTWAEPVQACDRCGREVSEDHFDAMARRG